MPLEDEYISKEPDGTFNEEYCKWCYSEGKFIYTSLDELVDFLVEHTDNEQWTKEQARGFFESELPKLSHWRKDSKE